MESLTQIQTKEENMSLYSYFTNQDFSKLLDDVAREIEEDRFVNEMKEEIPF